MKKQNVDLNGIGQIKAKAVKSFIPKEPIIKKKAEKRIDEHKNKIMRKVPTKKEKPIKETQSINNHSITNDTAFRKNLTENLIPELKNENNLSSFTVYYADNEDFLRKIYGDELESDLVIERCLSYTNPVIIINPNGITDNRVYKSRYITRLYTDNGMYLICASSYSIEAFRGNASERITQRLYELLNPYKEFVWGNC